MKIVIRNPEKKVSSKTIRDATKFYTKLLLTERQSRNISLTIKVKCTGTAKGYIEWEDRPVKPRAFTITLSNRYKTKETLKSLAHEIAHMKQYVRGELTDNTSRSKARWKHQELDDDTIHYFDLPWEIDAFGREEGLYRRYLEWAAATKFLKG